MLQFAKGRTDGRPFLALQDGLVWFGLGVVGKKERNNRVKGGKRKGERTKVRERERKKERARKKERRERERERQKEKGITSKYN